MMHGHEESDSAIVAVKPTNKAEQSAAELVERRAGTEGNVHWQSTLWTQCQVRVSQRLGRIRHFVCRQHPRWEPCGKAARTDLCGGRSEMSVPTASNPFLLHCKSP